MYLTQSYNDEHTIDWEQQVFHTINENNEHVGFHFRENVVHQLQRNCFIIKYIQFR